MVGIFSHLRTDTRLRHLFGLMVKMKMICSSKYMTWTRPVGVIAVVQRLRFPHMGLLNHRLQ